MNLIVFFLSQIIVLLSVGRLEGLFWVSIVVTAFSTKRIATWAQQDRTGYESGFQIKDNCPWKLHYGNHR